MQLAHCLKPAAFNRLIFGLVTHFMPGFWRRLLRNVSAQIFVHSLRVVGVNSGILPLARDGRLGRAEIYERVPFRCPRGVGRGGRWLPECDGW